MEAQMKVLVITPDGEGLDLTIRAMQAGHQVKMFLSPASKHKDVGQGIVPRVHDWRQWMKWADLIFLANVADYLDELQPYFEKGFPIFGTNKYAAQLEIDRMEGQRIFEACGIETIPFEVFDSLADAEAFVWKTKRRFVSKPNGDVARSLSYVSKSPADMIFMLRKWTKQNIAVKKFILQEFVPGTEIAVSGWFGPSGWASVFCENFEHKKLMAGDIGPNTGEMGTAVKYVTESKLAEELLEPLTEALHALKFVGSCDVSVLMTPEGKLHPMEFTMRPGWPYFFIQTHLHKGDPVEWMLHLLHGEDRLKVRSDHAIGVVYSIDFPDAKTPAVGVEDIPIYGINEGNWNNIHLQKVKATKAPCMVGDNVVEQDLFGSAGDELLTIVGLGSDVQKARDKAYNVLDQISMPFSPIYRPDIGSRVEKDLPKLQAKGYCTEWRW
jgi:phosphoribosylamine--glycine ligase